MSPFVDVQALSIGACHSLAHAVQVVTDASCLHASGRYASAVHLTVMATEELGRFHLMVKQRHAVIGGAAMEPRAFAKQLREHLPKLEAGQVTVPLPMTAEETAEFMNALERGDMATAERVSISHRTRVAAHKPTAAATLHQVRLRAQYVDYDSNERRWSSPAETTRTDSDARIRMAMNDVANALIAVQSLPWLIQAFEATGVARPWVGPFTHTVFAALASDA